MGCRTNGGSKEIEFQTKVVYITRVSVYRSSQASFTFLDEETLERLGLVPLSSEVQRREPALVGPRQHLVQFLWTQSIEHVKEPGRVVHQGSVDHRVHDTGQEPAQ